jgi:hypothetical protein
VEDLPANSHRLRREPDVEEKTDKKVEKVVTGGVSRRKKPLGTRFVETIFGGDGKGVFQYILLDVLVPAAKDTIADVVSQGIERALFGESRSSSRRTGTRTPSSSGYVSYNRYSGSPLTGRRDEPREVSRRARGTHDFDEIILATRVEAEEVLGRMDDLLRKYETVSVGDLYELVGVDSSYTDEKWGWVDLANAGIRRVRSGYLLDLPKPESLR